MPKKIKSYDEAELIGMFGLQRTAGNLATPLMAEWTGTSTTLIEAEAYFFDLISKDLINQIVGWNEEMLKMNFISPVLILGHIRETAQYKTYYENLLEATVKGHFLKVRTDMMIATGILETPKIPYFYFQEYKKQKDYPPSPPKFGGKKGGDVTAQLLEAFLIAQEKNKNDKPLYGCTISGRYWEFVIMEGTTYCISKSYDCTETDDLLQIIAILRKFKEILETRLL